MFFKTNTLKKSQLTVFKEQGLLHGFYGPYTIISNGHTFDIYCSAIDFFRRFKEIFNFHKANLPIAFADITGPGGNRAFMLFSSLKGHGLLIKMLDRKYGGGINKELDIMRIGKIIGANIPKSAIVIRNQGTPIFKSFRNNDVFVEALTPVALPFREANHVFDQIIEYDGVNLGKLFTFDITTGSWDRHQGNYLISKLRGRYSLQEIDFGLFQPDFFPPPDFKEDNDIRQDYPSKYPKLPGWAIIIHPKVRKLMSSTNRNDFLTGLKKGVKNLYEAVVMHHIEQFISDKLYKRIIWLFIEGKPTQKLFLLELEKLGYNSEKIKAFLDRYPL